MSVYPFTWEDIVTPELTKAERKAIAQSWNENEEQLIATKWLRDRQEEYPSIQDLVVALYDDEDLDAVKTKRAEIKAKYPKPE